MVYNGDEVSALVVDFGSYTTRAGYAGEDCPRVVCPSFFGYTHEPEAEAEGGQDGGGDVSMSEAETAPTNGNGETSTGKKGKRKLYVGEDGVGVWRMGMEVDNMMLDGVLHDTEAAGALLHHILHKRLSVDPSEHPLMLTEPAWNTSKAREQLAEMAFEGEKVPALYFGSAGVLSAFAAGKPTALVLDVGYANSSAVPVVDGYALRAGTKRQPLASQLITSQLLAHLSSPPASSSRTQPISLLPHALIAKRSPNTDSASAPGQAPPTRVAPTLRQDRLAEGATTASWRNWAEMSVVEQWKEACLEVVPVGRYDKETTGKLAEQVAYEFPDGWGGSFGEERFREGEVWYDPKNYFDQSIEPPAPLRLTQTTAHSHSLKDSVSLSQLVHDSIMACDVDIRAALLQNIVVVGNGAGTRGLTERLDWELAALMPSQKIKIHSPTIPYEKRYAGWLGGSILASLGTFHQLWVTKDEYEEHGMQIIHQHETCKSPRKRAPKAWLTTTLPSAATAAAAPAGGTTTDDTATAAAATDNSFQPSFLSQELTLSKRREKRLFSLREQRLTTLRGSSDASFNKEILDPHMRIQHLGDVFLAATTPSVQEAVTERIQAAIKSYGTNQLWTPTRFERIAVTAVLVGQYLDKEYARVSDEAEGSFQDTVRRRIADRVSRLSPTYDKETSTLTLIKHGGPVQSINLRSSSLERKALIADVTSGGLLETVARLKDTERSWAIDTLGMSDLVDEFNPVIYQLTGNGAAREEESWLWGLKKDRKLDMWLMEISAAMRARPAWRDQVGSNAQQ